MSKSNLKQVCCFGEVLWDIFPEHSKIGGAPLNVALRTHSFGIPITFISKIGKDQLGVGILDYLNNLGVDPSNIQHDSQLPTGTVKVQLDDRGAATYDIVQPVAWDNIEFNEDLATAVAQSEVFVFGSLICRDGRSKSTLLSLLRYAKTKVFDVNLRPPYYSFDLLEDLMNKADFIKCNDEELHEICNHLVIESNDLEDQVSQLALRTNSTHICVTLGADGALLYTESSFYRNNGYQVTVNDTVGAGDSFLGTLISKLLIEKTIPSKALAYACAMGALVAAKEGANPAVSSTEIKALLNG